MKKLKAEDALALANFILMWFDEKELDPTLCYSALGCAFQQLHQGLGKSKKEWLSITREMADKKDWSENEP